MPQANAPELTPEILQANPVLAVYLVFVSLTIMVVLIGSIASWFYIFYRSSQPISILPIRSDWQPSRWGLVDVIAVAISTLLMQVLAASAFTNAQEVDESKTINLEMAAAGSLAGLMAVALGTAWICGRFRVSPAHVGFTSPRWSMVAIGIVGGLAALPPLYLLMMVVTSLANKEYDHPLIDSATQSGQLDQFLLAVFAAAIAAPIVEEFVFRVVLQGWMQSIPLKRLTENILGRDQAIAPQPHPIELSHSDPIQLEWSPLRLPDAAPQNPFAVDSMANELVERSEAELTSSGQRLAPPIWPCFVTGILFGLAHFEYGVSFIPLSFLGIYLGWIYRQTQSIWPCIIIHMMLNSLSMIMLGLAILMKQAGLGE